MNESKYRTTKNRIRRILISGSTLLLQLGNHAVNAWMISWSNQKFDHRRGRLHVSPPFVNDPISNNAGGDMTMATFGSLPLGCTFDELSHTLRGRGRAEFCWDCYRIGVDPLWYYSGNDENETEHVGLLGGEGWSRSQLRSIMCGRRQDHGLGPSTLEILESHFGWMELEVATLSKISTSLDGTTKLLLKLQDGLEVESVVRVEIEWRRFASLCTGF